MLTPSKFSVMETVWFASHSPTSAAFCSTITACAAEEQIPLYLRQGFALRAIRPLDSLAPCFLLQAGCLAQNVPPVWLPLADRVHIAILLARGYAALESRESPQGTVLALYPV